jgi:hypothetical protein
LPTTPDARPSLTPALDALVALLVTLDDLAGVRASDVLVMALGAHGHVAASVRSLDGASVTVARKRRRVELGLRPPFFLEGDAPRRLATLIHELLHLDGSKPGALLDERRHAHRTHATHERHARRLAKRWLDENDPVPLLCLAHHGEVRMRTWRHRPIEGARTRAFTDADVFEAPLLMATPKGARGSWW